MTDKPKFQVGDAVKVKQGKTIFQSGVNNSYHWNGDMDRCVGNIYLVDKVDTNSKLEPVYYLEGADRNGYQWYFHGSWLELVEDAFIGLWQ